MPNSKRKPILPMAQERIDEFWSHVDRSDSFGCWPWTAGRDSLGYGVFQVRSTKGWDEPGKRSKRCGRVHRIAYALYHGYDPSGLICHRCDHPYCCNPACLFEGTDTDNVWDRERKGRSNNPHQKLTPEQVNDIRHRYATTNIRQDVLAEEYGVHVSTIGRLLRGDCWGFLKRERPHVRVRHI